MGKAIAWHFRAELNAYRVALAQVTLEYLLIRSYLNSPEGTGIHAGKTLGAFTLIDNYCSCVFIHVHGIRDGTSLLARCVLTVITDYGEG